jgi:hypothetical protein
MNLHTSYGQKSDRDSNCQLDSRPLKVTNRLEFFAFKWHETYHWKALDKGYNFALDFTSIGGLHTKLWAPKVAKVLKVGVLGQNDIWVLVLWLSTNYTTKGKVVASPSLGHGESCESVFTRGSFMHKKGSSYALTNL